MIHLTPEGKRYILEHMLCPKSIPLFTKAHRKDDDLPDHNSLYSQAKYPDLLKVCEYLNPLNGWKFISQIGIYDWNYTLLAVLADEGSKPYDSFNFRGEGITA